MFEVKSVVIITNEFSKRKILDQPVFVWNMYAFLRCEPVSFVFEKKEFADLARKAYPDADISVGRMGDVYAPAGLISIDGARTMLSGVTVPTNLVMITDADSLIAAQRLARRTIAVELMENGVEFTDISAVYISPISKIGAGTLIMPGTVIEGHTVIGEGCTVGPHTHIKNCNIGSGTTVTMTDMTDSTVGSDCQVGPFAYIRPGCTVGDRAKIGDFVEIKISTVGSDTKFSHLTYVGDSDVGRNVNVGCGCVVVNYDGQKKTRTTVGNDAFIGCNTNLVSPVKVGDRAYIACGATITEDVPDDAFAIARSKQTVKPGGAKGRFGKVGK